MTLWRMSIVVGIVAMVPAAAHAQRFQVTPLFSTAQVYDTNLFSAPVDPQADTIWRVSPGVKSDYVSARLTLLSRYSFDIEHFADHPEFTSMHARQQGAIDFTHRPTPRAVWRAGAEFAKTPTPAELAPITGLTFTRATARRVAVHSSLTHRLDMRTAGEIKYRFSDESVAESLVSGAHSATMRGERQFSPRNAASIDYTLQQFRFGTASATSHALSAGWVHSVTPRTVFSISGGPRVTNGTLAPDVSASLRYEVKPADWSLTYTRTQTTVIGLAGVADTQNIATFTAWSLPGSVKLRLGPALFRTTLAGRRANVFHLTVRAARPLAHGLSLDVGIDSTIQNGDLHVSLGPGREHIARHMVTIQLVAAPAPVLR